MVSVQRRRSKRTACTRIAFLIFLLSVESNITVLWSYFSEFSTQFGTDQEDEII
jgi:hypothetical protein